MRPKETCARCNPARRDRPVRSRCEFGLRRCVVARSWVFSSAAVQSSLRVSSGMALSSTVGGTAERFDAIPVGVDRESGVITRAVFAADARAAIVLAAGAERGAMKRLHGRLVRREKAEMQPRSRIGRHWRFGRRDPQRDLARAIAEQARAVAQTAVAERRQRGVIKAFGPRDVAHPNRDMVEHDALLFASLFDWLGTPSRGRLSARPL